jgi:hypothetical protein
MDELTIKTNHNWRNFSYRYEVPKKVLEDQFDYQDPNDVIDGFFKYRDYWYHLDMFMRIENNSNDEFSKWHGCHNDSFFSGVLIRVSDDGEQYQVATFFS